MTTNNQRLTPEREAHIRKMSSEGWAQDWVAELIAELDAVRRELDEARTITDAMVERLAIQLAILGPSYTGDPRAWWLRLMPERRESYLRVARRALTAAMAKDSDK